MDIIEQIAAAPSHEAGLAAIVAFIKADSGTVHLLGSDGWLHLVAATPGMPQAVLSTIAIIPVGKGMAGLAVERAAPVNACNIQTDSSGDVRPGARTTGLAGAIVVPMIAADRVVGALGVANRAERVFSPAEIELLMAAGRVLAAKEHHGTTALAADGRGTD